MEGTSAATVDEFIAARPEEFRPTLERLRALIRSEAPEAEERIAYGVPAYRLHYDLVSFGATHDACSFYTQSPALVKRMKEELRGVKVSGATLHFPPGEPLPEELLRRIIRARVEENEARAASRK